MRRKLIGVLIVLVVCVVAVALIRSSSKVPTTVFQSTGESGGQLVKDQQQPPKDVFELERARQGTKPGLESRFGEDDGLVAAIFYGGDTMGNLEVCG
jgi:hypothetical protein